MFPHPYRMFVRSGDQLDLEILGGIRRIVGKGEGRDGGGDHAAVGGKWPAEIGGGPDAVGKAGDT